MEIKRSFFVPKQNFVTYIDFKSNSSTNRELQHLFWQLCFLAPYITPFSQQSSGLERCLTQCKVLSKLHLWSEISQEILA